MMIRAFLLFLVAASLTLRGSEPISIKYEGATSLVKQPHVTAEMIPLSNMVSQGGSLEVILHLHSNPGWHTYWVNPGDAGLATKIQWILPPGLTAEPIQWPTPEKHSMGPLVTYGYEGDVYLITKINVAATVAGGPAEIKAKASWLVCQEACIPGKGEFTLNINVIDLHFPGIGYIWKNTEFFKAAEARLPFINEGWNVKGTYAASGLEITFSNKQGHPEKDMGKLQFFPEQQNVLDPQAKQESEEGSPTPADFSITIPLVQNGEKPAQISGVMVSDVSLVGEAKGGDSHAVLVEAFPVTVADGDAAPPLGTAAATTEGAADGGHRPPLKAATEPSQGPATATSEGEAPGTHRTPEQGEGGMMAASKEAKVQPLLIAVLGAAFIGGLILNLMPCVLPVLSLKVFSMIKHAEHDHSKVWKQGVAFTVGVVISFWLLAGGLLILRGLGNQIGWGFQMQSPGFVLALVFIFFLLGLNLFGVFELGTSLVGLDAKVAGNSNHGLLTSFLNGALATLAATPCTAPFMGSALGFAAQQPAFISLLIFTFLAFGMAAPYLLLTIFPGALKFVPKPGAWMEAFKQFMGFLLMGTVIFLLYVFGAQVGQDGVYLLLFGLLVASVGGWIYGGWQRSAARHGLMLFIALLLVLAGLGLGADAAMSPMKSDRSDMMSGGYQPWSQEAVEKALAEGKPVFVDFTAAWCLSCKVNERVALDTDVVKKAFADKGLVLFKADWTNADPKISEALQKYGRDGVPLYLLYSPKDAENPQVLPEVLTPGIVLDALGKI